MPVLADEHSNLQPGKADRTLLLVGLVLYLAALVGIFSFGATDKSQTALDWFHWLMIIGAMLQLPFAVNLRRNLTSVAAAALMTVGLICTIGMCVLDLVFWSLPDPNLAGPVAAELMATPSVWSVFMLYGSEEVLYAGFVLAGLTYWQVSRIGPALIALGAVLAIAGPSWFNVAGAACVLAGFGLVFAARTSQAA